MENRSPGGLQGREGTLMEASCAWKERASLGVLVLLTMGRSMSKYATENEVRHRPQLEQGSCSTGETEVARYLLILFITTRATMMQTMKDKMGYN